MGEIKRGICPNCGYQKDLHVGGGLAANNVSVTERIFPADITDLFKREREAGRVRSYLLEHLPGVCMECGELVTIPYFHYELESGETRKYATACGKCGKPAELFLTDEELEKVLCPKCGKKMDFVAGGHWD